MIFKILSCFTSILIKLYIGEMFNYNVLLTYQDNLNFKNILRFK